MRYLRCQYSVYVRECTMFKFNKFHLLNCLSKCFFSIRSGEVLFRMQRYKVGFRLLQYSTGSNYESQICNIQNRENVGIALNL